MLDATPAPFGEVTRRFTHLAEAAARHLTGCPASAVPASCRRTSRRVAVWRWSDRRAASIRQRW